MKVRLISIAGLLFVAGSLAGSLAGCASEDGLDGDAGEEWVEGKGDGETLLAYRRIVSSSQFDGMALANGGVVIQGPSMKFLIDRRNPASPQIYFQNANFIQAGKKPDSARYHFNFGQAVLPGFAEDLNSFNDRTYTVQDKRYVAGTIQTYKLDPNSDARTYGIQFYPEDVASEETILQTVQAVKKAFRVPNVKMAFVASGPQQTTVRVAAAIKALGVANTSVDQLLGSLKYLPMNYGEAWGFLRIFPTNSDDLTPQDIAVLDELPLDLAVVAGVITKSYQDASSHVNLKSKERGTPDMVLRDAGPSNPLLAPFANQPVHLVVKSTGFVIEPTTAAIVQQKFAERTNKPWIPVGFVPESKPFGFEEMCPGAPTACIDAQKKFGSKAANLGLLQHRNFLGRTTDLGSLSAKAGYNLTPGGIGVPVQFYRDFVDFAPNTALRTKLNGLISAEKAGTLSPSQRKAMAEEVRLEFYRAQMPAGMLTAILAKLNISLPGAEKIKVRSSANAEDLANFDGAGLHDSFSAKMSNTDNPDGSCAIVANTEGVTTKLEIKPKTLNCAVKGVWASLWNKRAIEERSFARLDHVTVGMGIAIVSKYDEDVPVVANAVLVTRVIGNEGLYGYTFSTQVGNNLVTNPNPGTFSENVIAGFADARLKPTFTVTRFATPVKDAAPLTARVLGDAAMTEVLNYTRAVETAYCKAKRGYYPGDCSTVTLDPGKPAALDLELKVLENGQYVFKQVREFAGK
jgi:hypothetical protein